VRTGGRYLAMWRQVDGAWTESVLANLSELDRIKPPFDEKLIFNW